MVGIVLYGNVFAQAGQTRLFMILSLVAAAAAVGVSFSSMHELANLLEGAAAVLLFAGFCFSAAPMVTPIAYWYAGLYDYGTVSAYFTFAIVWAIAWLLALIGGFIGIAKKAGS